MGALAMAWSMMESASRMEPSPASASRSERCASARMPSWPAIWAELARMSIELDGVETEVLAARADGLGNILRLGGRHHEDDVVRRLLQGLQQRVEGRVGDLMGLVEDVDLVAIARGA
jgi:hypothetical protein